MTPKRGRDLYGPVAGPDLPGRAAQKASDQRAQAERHALFLIPCRVPNCSTVASVVDREGDGYQVEIRGPIESTDGLRYTLTGDRSGGHGAMFCAIPTTGDGIVAILICRRGHTTEIHARGLRAAIQMANVGGSSRAAE